MFVWIETTTNIHSSAYPHTHTYAPWIVIKPEQTCIICNEHGLVCGLRKFNRLLKVLILLRHKLNMCNLVRLFSFETQCTTHTDSVNSALSLHRIKEAEKTGRRKRCAQDVFTSNDQLQPQAISRMCCATRTKKLTGHIVIHHCSLAGSFLIYLLLVFPYTIHTQKYCAWKIKIPLSQSRRERE